MFINLYSNITFFCVYSSLVSVFVNRQFFLVYIYIELYGFSGLSEDVLIYVNGASSFYDIDIPVDTFHVSHNIVRQCFLGISAHVLA